VGAGKERNGMSGGGGWKEGGVERRGEMEGGEEWTKNGSRSKIVEENTSKMKRKERRERKEEKGKKRKEEEERKEVGKWKEGGRAMWDEWVGLMGPWQWGLRD